MRFNPYTITGLLLMLLSLCPLRAGAQTLTATYVLLADSADFYMRHERWDDAERTIVKALRLEPANRSNYLLWSNLGTVRTRLDKLDGALEAFQIGLASAPNSTVLLSNRARTYLLKGDSEAALADINHALALDSTLQWPRKMRGLINASRRNYDAAKADFKIYSDKYGDDADILGALADIAASTGKDLEALDYYKRSYKLDPDEELLEKALLTACVYGRIEDMTEELNEGLRKNPRSGMLYLMRAMLNKARHQNSEMEENLKKSRQFGVNETIYNQLAGSGQ